MSDAAASRVVKTPFGPLLVRAEEGEITRITWAPGHGQDEEPVLIEAETQLIAYFRGERQSFDLPLRVKGGTFQRAVCDEMLTIPFGQTLTYGDIARRLGAPPQAVGQACGGNPIPVVIPCHRVLGATGLGGYSGGQGIETKVALLRHEGAAGLLI